MLDLLNDWRNRWFPSASALASAPDSALEETWADYRELAGGLEELLRQCSKRGAERHFPATLHGLRRIRRQLRRGARPELSAQQLSDLCHEIAQYAEQGVLEAGLRCLRRAAEVGSTMPSALADDSSSFAIEATRPMHAERPSRPPARVKS